MATTIHEPPQIDFPRNSGGDSGHFVPNDGDLHVRQEHPSEPAKTGIWVAFAAITMSFAALTSALVVRQGTALDWQHIALPPVLYFNTFILLTSSLTLELARRRISVYALGFEAQMAEPMRWLIITVSLGLVFVIGQYLAWLRLKDAGLYLATNPSSSFFYVFTGVHALHVLGGLCGLLYIMSKLRRSVLRRSTFHAAAQYWHFMGLLWVYLLFVLGRML